jgi:hypothetical protein
MVVVFAAFEQHSSRERQSSNASANLRCFEGHPRAVIFVVCRTTESTLCWSANSPSAGLSLRCNFDKPLLFHKFAHTFGGCEI